MTEKWGKWLGTSRDMSIVNRSEIFSESHPANFWDILKREEKSMITAFVWSHRDKIFSVESHSSLLNLVFRMPHQSQSKWRFSTPILSEKIVGFPDFKRDIDIAKNFFSFHRNSEILYLNHNILSCVNNLHFKIFFECTEDCLSTSLWFIHNKWKQVPQGS